MCSHCLLFHTEMSSDIRKYLVKYTREEYEERKAEQTKVLQEQLMFDRAVDKHRVDTKKQRERDLAREWQRKHRAKKIKQDVIQGQRDCNNNLKKVKVSRVNFNIPIMMIGFTYIKEFITQHTVKHPHSTKSKYR